MWVIEAFAEQTEEHLGDLRLNTVVAESVERLLGEFPRDPTPDQVRVIAPLFDLAPSTWEYVTKPTTQGASLSWLEMALLHLLSTVTGAQPQDLFGYVFPISRPQAQAMLRRFASDTPTPEGDLFIAYAGLLSLSQSRVMLEPFAWARTGDLRRRMGERRQPVGHQRRWGCGRPTDRALPERPAHTGAVR